MRKFTIGCYIALLLLPYCYGTALPEKGLNWPHNVDNFIAPSSGHATANISWVQLSELIKEGDQYHDDYQYFQSIEIYKEALQKYMQSYTQKTLLLAQLYNNMGMSYLALKDYTQTEFCYNKALTIRQTLLDKAISSGNASLKKEISEITGKSHHNLGILYLELKQPSEAILSFEAALKTQWQYHVEAMDTQYILASTYQQMESYQASKKLYEVILDRQAKTSYLQPTAIAIIKKYLSQVNEKIEKTDEISPFNRSVTDDNNAIVLPQLQLSQKSLSPSLVGINKVAQKERQPQPKPPQSKRQIFSCEQCGQHCKGQYALTIHMRSHTGEKPFACSVCGKNFSRKQHIKGHMRIHTGEKFFACPVCQKKFTQKEYIKIHMRIHTGDKPFACAFCQKTFAQKQHMKDHMRVHTGKRPFSCPVCAKNFARQHYMKQHMRVHTGEKPFACSSCNKKFTQKQYLTVHMRVHTGEKPFACPLCGKKFSQQHSMQTHQRVHTEEKLFSCPVCYKKFSRKDNMKKHCTRIHK